MPLSALLRVFAKRWYVVVLGVVLSLGGAYAAHDRPGVYFAEVQLVLVAPAQTYYPNTIAEQPFQLAPLAGLLVTDWNGTRTPLLTSSSETTLYGEGVRSGVQVRLPNQGSQFQPLFDAPYVDVQVVGPSEDQVAAEVQRVVDQLRLMLQRRQDYAGVPDRLRVTSITSPQTLDVSYVPGSGTRAAAATLALGLVGSALLALLADRLLGRRGRRPVPAVRQRGATRWTDAHQGTQVSSL